MTDSVELNRRIHDLDVTLRVGKGGIETVVEELERQLDGSDLVKVRFLRAARTDPTPQLAAELGRRAEAELVQTRGHTAVYR